jgi:hypothetical protein
VPYSIVGISYRQRARKLTGDRELAQRQHGKISKTAATNGAAAECAESPAAPESSRARNDRLAIESNPRHAPVADSVTPLARQVLFPANSMHVTDTDTMPSGVATGNGSKLFQARNAPFQK